MVATLPFCYAPSDRNRSRKNLQNHKTLNNLQTVADRRLPH
jgi:hypothetical protein